MSWTSWDAYKQGLIDQNGKRLKDVKMETDAQKASYTPFIRLAANVKRLLGKVPGLGSSLGSFAAGLFLIKEKYGLNDDHLTKIIREVGIQPSDFLEENSQWFLLEDGTLSPGVYRMKHAKICNRTLDEIILPKDQVKVFNGIPIGDVFGINVYEAKHLRTNQDLYITIGEIYK
jgi:hypothetical protein